MKKIRIMHIVQSPGGVERFIKSFLKYIDKDKYENILVCSHDYLCNDYVDLADEFENVNMIRNLSFFTDVRAIVQMRKLIKKYHPDIVFCHSSKAGAIGRIANIGMKNKCIYNAHGWAFNMKNTKKKAFLYAIIERVLSYLCDKIICISEAEKISALSHKICTNSKLEVIENGIDFEQYKGSDINKCMLGIPNDAYVIGNVGRLCEQKASDVFVKAAKIIKQQIPHAYFLMVGDGESRMQIENMIYEYNLQEYFTITGWVDNPMAYIKNFDVATLLSRWEGFGLVLPEYMLAQKPIVATRVDAIPFIIEDGMNGTLVSMDNYKEVAEAVIEIYKNIEKTEKYKKNGFDIVRSRFNVETMVLQYEKLFQKILE